MRSISSPSLLPIGGGRFSAVGCAPGWSVSSGFWPEEALSACAARLPGVSKSSILPLRALVVPRGALLLAFAVKVSTCFAREATSFLVRPTFSERRRTFPSSGLLSRCRQ
ncbi:hypothetical protein F2Q70_00025837 [Brassica cretica]|uniref:Uncharacterized protein n=1 Tax=Brassica cretica TaxID=69181 RepID=A0A8S9L410_BRACR|nr:hypothetical protein F2Q70_00025837 [Brassica cretica]